MYSLTLMIRVPHDYLVFDKDLNRQVTCDMLICLMDSIHFIYALITYSCTSLMVVPAISSAPISIRVLHWSRPSSAWILTLNCNYQIGSRVIRTLQCTCTLEISVTPMQCLLHVQLRIKATSVTLRLQCFLLRELGLFSVIRSWCGGCVRVDPMWVVMYGWNDC